MPNTFIVSDESRNNLGVIIKTAGIDINQFKRNPVMLYMHDREKGVVGRWENIRKDGKQLLADAVFDDSTDLGKQVKNQVENGFLRSASIGIEVIETKTIDGVETVTQSVLTEISIVDIPANDNALKLYRKSTKGNRVFIALGLDPGKKDLKSELVRLLQLSEDATDEAILAVISRLLETDGEEPVSDVDNAIKAGLIGPNDRKEYLTMARISPGLFRSIIEREKDKRRGTLEMMIDNAIKERKIMLPQKDMFLSIGERIGVNDLSRLLLALVPVRKITSFINRDSWTLDDYRRLDPMALKRDPALYKSLVEQEENKPKEKTLDYYRRYDPDYLRDNPEEYERLLKQD